MSLAPNPDRRQDIRALRLRLALMGGDLRRIEIERRAILAEVEAYAERHVNQPQPPTRSRPRLVYSNNE